MPEIFVDECCHVEPENLSDNPCLCSFKIDFGKGIKKGVLKVMFLKSEHRLIKARFGLFC
jgi:hypothetical protein